MRLIDRITAMTLDYAHAPVPGDRTIQSWRLFGVWFATIVSLGLINIGIVLAQDMSFRDAAIAIVVAQSIVAVLFAVSAWVGASTRMTIGMMVQCTLGRYGSALLLLAIAMASVGWFAFQLEVFAKAAISTLGLRHTRATEIAFVAGGGIAMLSTAVIGFKAIERLSQLATPALVILVAWPLLRSLLDDPTTLQAIVTDTSSDYPLTWTNVLVPMVSGPALGLLVVPDVARYGRSASGAAAVTALSFFVGGVLIFLLAFALGRLAPSDSIAQVLPALGMGLLGLSLLLLAAWTTNDSNIYFASLAIATAIRRSRKWEIALACGTLGIGAAFLSISESFVPWLTLLGSVFYPAATVFLLDFASHRHIYIPSHSPPPIRPTTLLAWLLGSAVALLFPLLPEHFPLTTRVPLIDAIIVTALTFTIGTRLTPALRHRLLATETP